MSSPACSIHRPLGPNASALVLFVALFVGCDSESHGEPAQGAPPALPTPADKSTSAEKSQPAGAKHFEATTDPSALPTSPLDAARFVADPCLVADAKQLSAYLAFATAPFASKLGERNDRGECIYESATPPTQLKVYFDASVRPREADEMVTLAGVGAVRVRNTTKLVEITIPFAAAKDAQRPPADRIFIRLMHDPHRTKQSWEPGYSEPEKESYEAAARGIAENLIHRLKLEK